MPTAILGSARRATGSLLVLLAVGGCGRDAGRSVSSSPTPPPAPPAPATRDVAGVVLNNAEKPFTRPVSVILDPYLKPQTVAAEPDGRFVLTQVHSGAHTLAIKAGDTNLYMRRRLVAPESAFTLPIEVPAGAEPLDLGTVYVEAIGEGSRRIAKTFGPYCDRARAGQPLKLAEEQMPLPLFTLGGDGWAHDFIFKPEELNGVAVACRYVTKKDVGTYAQTGTPGYDYTWAVTVVTRDGRTLRKVFRAPAPRRAKAGEFGVKTGQEERLESESKTWLAAALGGPA